MIPLLLRQLAVFVVASLACVARSNAETPPAPVPLSGGPYLFLDDHLIMSSEGIIRRVVPPKRDLVGPVITGKEDGCFQPYVTVLRDNKTGRFRVWYGAPTEDRSGNQTRIHYMESNDGITWQRPHRILDDPGGPIQFGVSVIDEGAAFNDPAKRYKFGWWHGGGLKVAASPDGLAWTPLGAGVVLKHSHDINGIWRDFPRNRYIAIGSINAEDPQWKGDRRLTFQSESQDLLNWSELRNVLRPDERDVDGTQFYAMDGFLQRGDTLIGMVKVLRDDLKADDPPDPAEAYGIGYTTLAWTRDGKTWTRDRDPFFDRHPQPGAWDHAHAWIDEQLQVGDETYLYYGGYARGHKVNRFEERQIGLLRMKRDRYVARVAGEKPAKLRTAPVRIDAGALTVNAAVASPGEIRVRLLDDSGAPMAGYDWTDCKPIYGDGVALPVTFAQPLSTLQGKTVRLEFSLRFAELYGFEAGGVLE